MVIDVINIDDDVYLCLHSCGFLCSISGHAPLLDHVSLSGILGNCLLDKSMENFFQILFTGDPKFGIF